MKKRVRLKYKRIIVLITAILFIIFVGPIMAKFITDTYHSYYLSSKHFYFTSNRLKKNNPTYLVNNWSGVGSFSIDVGLSSMKNSLVYSSFDIPYTVRYVCPTGVTCSFDKNSSTIYGDDPNHADSVVLSVNPGRTYTENERLSIYIEATSTSPYVETIGAYFEYVVGKQGITYEIEDEANRPYMILKITSAISFCKVTEAFLTYQVNDTIDSKTYMALSSENKLKCVSKKIDLSFNPNTILLDTTSNIIEESTYTTQTISSVDYINSLSFGIGPVSTMAIKFYKVNVANNYTYPFENNSSIVTVNVHD